MRALEVWLILWALWITMQAMNLKQTRFVQEYCVDFNATQAAIRAGYSAESAGQIGHELLKKHEITAAVDERMTDIAAAAEITTEAILRRWWDIANADPGELTQIRRVNCRHCYGVMHAYQWTEPEYMAATARAINAGQQAPDGIGGFDFNPEREPHDDCPECGGQGVEVVHLADTRRLKGAARRLFAGVQKTKDGAKVIMRDQDAALANLARCLGMFKDQMNLSGQVEFKPLSEFYGGADTQPDA